MTEESKKKILSKIVKTDSCWIWGGYIGVYGYGKIHVEGKHKRACKSCKRLKPQEYNVDKKLELVS